MDLREAKAFRVPRRRRKRVGRGPASGHGGTSTRGSKGQKARSGWSMHRPFEGGQMPLFRKVPKRGFSNARFRSSQAVVNLEDLSQFSAGSLVDPAALARCGIVRRTVRRVKVLAKGDLSVALTVRAHAFSQAAKERIEKAGGKVELVTA